VTDSVAVEVEPQPTASDASTARSRRRLIIEVQSAKVG
jgi:hypothetical protein